MIGRYKLSIIQHVISKCYIYVVEQKGETV